MQIKGRSLDKRNITVILLKHEKMQKMRKTQKTTKRSVKALQKETQMFGPKEEKQPDLEFFTIYDSKSQSYDIPTFAPNKNVLMRDVINMFKDPAQAKNKFLINAEDYSIFKIGSYDKKTGQVRSHNLEHVVNMHDLRAMAQPDASQQIINHQS